MKNLIIVFFILFILKANSALPFEVNKKFGKVSIEELKNNVCPIDSNAHAYYIFDEGSTSFLFVEGFSIKYNRHLRIKILDNSGLGNAEFEIPLDSYGHNRDDIGKIRAVTYNIENGNKIVSQKISKDAIFRKSQVNMLRQLSLLFQMLSQVL